MRQYLRYFFGTPRRLMFSLLGVGLIVVLICPNILAEALKRLTYALAEAVGPLIGLILTVLIVIAGLRIIFKGGKK